MDDEIKSPYAPNRPLTPEEWEAYHAEIEVWAEATAKAFVERIEKEWEDES